MNNLERLYLDYNATSPLSSSVINWLKSGEMLFANPSSQHADGKSSRKVINQSRSFLYKTFEQDERTTKLFFHSGATEGIHTFAYSLAEAARLSGQDLLICFSKVDHPAVVCLEDKYFGPHVKFLEIKRDKRLGYLHDENFESIKTIKDQNPELMILYHHLWVHNETGQVSPLNELVRFKKIPNLFIHVDAVQVPGKIPHWNQLSNGDIWTFSAHKFGALKGIGFSFFKSEVPFHSLITGGAQQSNLRSGTENALGIKTIALALSDLVLVDVKVTASLTSDLAAFMIEKLDGLGALIDGPLMASNTIYFYLNFLPSDVALALFDIHGLEISAGSACSSGAARPSAVLTHMDLGTVAKNGLRLSLPFDLTEDFVAKVKLRLTSVFDKIQKS